MPASFRAARGIHLPTRPGSPAWAGSYGRLTRSDKPSSPARAVIAFRVRSSRRAIPPLGTTLAHSPAHIRAAESQILQSRATIAAAKDVLQAARRTLARAAWGRAAREPTGRRPSPGPPPRPPLAGLRGS